MAPNTATDTRNSVRTAPANRRAAKARNPVMTSYLRPLDAAEFRYVAQRIIVAFEGLDFRLDAIGAIPDGDRLRNKRDHLRAVIDERADSLELRGTFGAVGRAPFVMDELIELRHRYDILAGEARNAGLPPSGHHAWIGIGGPEERARLEHAGDEDLVDEHAFVDDVEIDLDAGIRDVLLDDLGDALNRFAGLHDHLEGKSAGGRHQLPRLRDIASNGRRATILEHDRRNGGDGPLAAEGDIANLLAVQRKVDRLPEAHIAKRRLVPNRIERQRVEIARLLNRGFDVRGALQELGSIRILEIGDVNRAALQGGQTRTIIGDDADRHLVRLGIALSPIMRITHERPVGVLLMRGDHEGTGPHQFLRWIERSVP